MEEIRLDLGGIDWVCGIFDEWLEDDGCVVYVRLGLLIGLID